MYSQPHHSLIFQNQPGFFLNASLQDVKSIMSWPCPLWHGGDRHLISFQKHSQWLGSFSFLPVSHPPTSGLAPLQRLPLLIWQLWYKALWSSLALYKETMIRPLTVDSPRWCQPVWWPGPLLQTEPMMFIPINFLVASIPEPWLFSLPSPSPFHPWIVFFLGTA